jgi:hypothetical protein
MMNISLSFPSISNIPEQKHIKDPYPSLTSPRPMSAVFAAEQKKFKDQRKEKKTLARLIILADFLQGKSDFCPSVFLGFWSSEGRTQGNSESRTKSCPRWQTVRTAQDENALKLVATEKLSSFFFCYQ